MEPLFHLFKILRSFEPYLMIQSCCSGVKTKNNASFPMKLKLSYSSSCFNALPEKLQTLNEEVSELDELERNGFPRRQCGQKFKYHSTRVKYAANLHILRIFLNKGLDNLHLQLGGL